MQSTKEVGQLLIEFGALLDRTRYIEIDGKRQETISADDFRDVLYRYSISEGKLHKSPEVEDAVFENEVESIVEYMNTPEDGE